MPILICGPLKGGFNGAINVTDRVQLIFSDALKLDNGFNIESLTNGKWTFSKLRLIVLRTFKLILLSSEHNIDILYYVPGSKGIALLKDTYFILLIKIFFSPRKVIHHLHTTEYSNINAYRKRIFAILFRNSEVIILSKSLDSYYQEIFPLVTRVHYLPNTVGPPVDCVQKIESDVLWLSNLFEDKGVQDMLDIVRELDSKKVNMQIHIVGNDADYKMKDVVNVLSSFNLRYVKYKCYGFLEGEAKYELFSRCSIFLFTSRREAFPLVILEAMQFGLSIVSSDVGAIPEMLSNTGCFVGPHNAAFTNKAAETIQELILNRKLRTVQGKNAKAKYDNNYSDLEFRNEILKIIDG